MTDRPILFSDPMVRALLEGRKTQTRRVLKPQPLFDAADECIGQAFASKFEPGDRLWVKETHCGFLGTLPSDWERTGTRTSAMPCGETVHLHYRADGGEIPWPHLKWKPSIYMPRWASRLTLLVTDVRVQRLQDIEGQHPTESDAIAEGVNAIHHGDGEYYYSAFRTEPHPKNWCDPADAFRELWNSIHGPDAWAENPWVAAISFDVVKANIDQVQP